MTDLARRIEHSLLKADATSENIKTLCAEALEFGFYSVCINPCHVPLAAGILKGSDVRVTTVIGFPLGASTTGSKVREAMEAVNLGADELDMVINVGALREGHIELVRREVSAVALAASGRVLKIILECCYLDDNQKALAAQAALDGGAHYLKTSTGFGPSGATVEDVRLLAGIARGRGARVKAAGGIRTFQDATAMIEAGAHLLGTSAGPAIMQSAAR